jgi:PPOX class probable F420-dependent enzyme
MTSEELRTFLAGHHRAVLVTRRRDGRLQTSPVVCALDAAGDAVTISVTQDRAKTRNLRRDPWATLCVVSDEFFGSWTQVEGEATIVDLPDALDGLKTLYRAVQGEHPDWADFEAAMARDRRCLIRIPLPPAADVPSA